MIHKKIFTVPANFNNTVTLTSFANEVLETFLYQFGFSKVGYGGWLHESSGFLTSITNSGNNFMVFATGINPNSNGYPSLVFPPVKQVYFKQENVSAGTGFVQVIVGENDYGGLWITISGFTEIDMISGTIGARIGDKVLRTNQGSFFHPPSSDIAGQIKPFMDNIAALPEKTHISDAVATNSGGFIIEEKVPGVLGYSSSIIEPRRLYTVNGKRYLALPNRLLLEC